MAEFPALPLWTDAYLADTRHLTTVQHGAYLLLLMEAWRRPHCDLPDDDVMLARWAGIPADEWTAMKPVVMAFWKRDGRSATFRQKRLTAERKYVADRSRVQKERIAKRWNKEKKQDTVVIPDGYRNDTPTPTPTPTPTIPLSRDNGPKAAFWDNAVTYLGGNGKRALIGKWLKEYGQDRTAQAITAAQLTQAVDPVSYITATLRKKPSDTTEWAVPC